MAGVSRAMRAARRTTSRGPASMSHSTLRGFGAARDAGTEVEEVRFVLFGRDAYEAFARALDA